MEARLPDSFGPALPKDARPEATESAVTPTVEPAVETEAAAEAMSAHPDFDQLLSVSQADMAYMHTVKFANQAVAERIKSGHAGDMPKGMRDWFLTNAGEPVSPTTALGVTWYLGPEIGDVKLVDHDMLVATGMDKPENQPGTLTWALGD